MRLSFLQRRVNFVRSREVLFVTHSSSSNGGAEFVFKTCIRSLPDVFSLKIMVPKSNELDSFWKDGVMHTILIKRYYQFNKESSIISFIKTLFNLVTILSNKKDLVNRYTVGIFINSSSCNLGFILSMLNQKKVICHIHEAPNHNSFQKIFFKLFFWYRMNSCHLIFVSNKLKTEWYRKYNLYDMHSSVIYNPVRSVKKIYQKHSEVFCFGFIGKLEENKRILELIEAFKIFMNRHQRSRIKLLIAGDGDLIDSVEFMMKGREDIIHIGAINDIDAYYNSIDVLVVPSKNESFSLVAAEAMSVGKPVITNTNVGISEVLQDSLTAMIYDPREPGNLVNAMEKIYSDNVLYKKIAINSMRLVKKLFINDKFSSHMKSLFIRVYDNQIYRNEMELRIG